jgi:hypothetical protein
VLGGSDARSEITTEVLEVGMLEDPVPSCVWVIEVSDVTVLDDGS